VGGGAETAAGIQRKRKNGRQTRTWKANRSGTDEDALGGIRRILRNLRKCRTRYTTEPQKGPTYTLDGLYASSVEKAVGKKTRKGIPRGRRSQEREGSSSPFEVVKDRVVKGEEGGNILD